MNHHGLPHFIIGYSECLDPVQRLVSYHGCPSGTVSPYTEFILDCFSAPLGGVGHHGNSSGKACML